MAQNYILLERIELAASAASVTFSSIPQSGYTDLKIVLSTRVDNGGSNDAVNMALNTDAFTTNASIKLLRGNGSSALSASGSYLITGYTNGSGSTANTFGNHEVYIPNYLSSNYKSISTDSVYEDNTTTAIQQINALLWSNTAAINKITFAPNGGSNFSIGSTFSLYGLAAVGTTPVIAPKAIGGDIVASDGTYWYHAFISSGTFTPGLALSCDVLTIAGGGGGGGGIGGGGGAGGVLGFATQSVSDPSTVTVGAGGAGSSNSGGGIGVQGGNSQFASLTASVGGGYGAYSNVAGGNGGSGGGTRGGGTNPSGGSPTSGQGYAGGSGTTNWGTGGGGAGQAGFSDGSGVTGAGGNGVNTYTNATWLSTALSTTGLGVSGYIAGGGGGGGFGTSAYGSAGGSGGGGAGGYTTTSVGANGVAATGSGGGGGGYSATGGNGGSGLVIIRYAV